MTKTTDTKKGLLTTPLTIYVTQNLKARMQELAKLNGVTTTRAITLYLKYGMKQAGKKA